MRRHIPLTQAAVAWAGALVALLAAAIFPGTAAAQVCNGQWTANVVAIDQPFFYNRLGAVNPAGMMFALRRDVVDLNGLTEAEGGVLTAGGVTLRPDKRPRPLTLRVNAGGCLSINFENLLDPARAHDDQPVTRAASVHVAGMQLVNDILDDGSNVGANPSSLVGPGGFMNYTLFAEKEGTFLLYSTGDTSSGEGLGGTLAMGLFGAVNVEPTGAEWYRSQLTQAEMALATVGTTPAGQPILDYTAVYPAGSGFGKDGLPIMAVLQGTEIVHSDLNAVITGPGRGDFNQDFPENPVQEPNKFVEQAAGAGLRPREEPFREFTVVFHDEIKAVQAFPGFYNDPVFTHTLTSVKDGFAINYGTGGIGSEIIANRLGVGPMFECVGCKYEEFFLTSWSVGDPAMVVDIPANAGLEALAPGQTPPAGAVGPKATMAMYPDDPSNVHHSYIGDRVKFRQLHAGPTEHHIFHLHAHQWLFNPDSDESLYLDSQAVGPGSGYTYEIAYNGSGNRNQTVGDSIFHCHFYPHFAQGMWELWRTHDVFEAGTVLAAGALPGEGLAAAGARALPDREIVTGTPIPAMVPLPTLAMAPMPGGASIDATGNVALNQADLDAGVNPGYPFYIPGQAGHRPPSPALDIVDDGGLPRHVMTTGVADVVTTRLDFSKEVLVADALELPEAGTQAEQVAMAFHATRAHPSYTQANTPLTFVANGLPPQQGSPYADPCMDDTGNAVGTPRLYKSATIQIDMKLNKVGWHYPQARINALWGDVADLMAGAKAPEPLFFRANTNDCITFQHTNLVPKDYELDDFQVRTPTDIIGQHIHLVKFDVTSSDGSANGWNYEDGTMSPGEVQERIAAFNAAGGLIAADGSGRIPLVAQAHPFFGAGPDGEWLGARTTVQRWYADDVLNNTGNDRTLRTVFTHDHYGPSTHQQVGLYSSLVVEPKDSVWRDSETGEIFGSRFDGGPTSFRADILTAQPDDAFREFMFQFADYALAYEAGGGVDAAGHPVPDPAKAISPPPVIEVGLPNLLAKPLVCPGGVPLPCPEAISSQDPGTFVVNYRNEPVAHRVLDNSTGVPAQAAGKAGDLAYVYSSGFERALPELNTQPGFYPPLTNDHRDKDPYTPLLRAYQGDKVQIRTQVGAHEEGHVMAINGIKWLQNIGDPKSGWRNAQMMGISEHFEFGTPIVPGTQPKGAIADYLYRNNTSSDGQWNGTWGLMRTYKNERADLLPLPSNRLLGNDITNRKEMDDACPKSAPVRNFDVTVALAADILPEGTLVYNPRVGTGPIQGPLHDPSAMMLVNTADLVKQGNGANAPVLLADTAPREPLILRAAAGECIKVKLRNILPNAVPDPDGFNTLPLLVENFNANHVDPSSSVGLHPQLVSYDVTKSDGMNIGVNPGNQTIVPGQSSVYTWYAGENHYDPATGGLMSHPIEYGAFNLMPADPIKASSRGLVGGMIIEPEGSSWVTDLGSHTQATISRADGTTYREFVAVWQDDLNLLDGAGNPVPNCCGEEANEFEDAGGKAINYRTEPLWFRLGFDPQTPIHLTRNIDFSDAVSNTLTGGADPVTPIFNANAGEQVVFRLLQGGGTNRNGVLNIHGHLWQRQPFDFTEMTASNRLADNQLSQYTGTQEGMGAGQHFNVVLDSAGGAFGVPGDYLMRDQAPWQFLGGRWSLLRVHP